jgi:hypothetical protein
MVPGLNFTVGLPSILLFQLIDQLPDYTRSILPVFITFTCIFCKPKAVILPAVLPETTVLAAPTTFNCRVFYVCVWD